MKINKKVIESAAVTGFTLVIMITAAVAGNGNTKADQFVSEEMTREAEPQVATKEKTAVGVVAAAEEPVLSQQSAYDGDAASDAGNAVTPDEAGAAPQAVDAGVPKTVPEAATEVPEAAVQNDMTANPAASDETAGVLAVPEETAVNPSTAEEVPAQEEVSPWAAKLMPNVESYLNIRAEANEESEVLGKLYKGAAADILERGEEWSKITSGSVEGYVKNEYCVFDAEAEDMANELGTVYATATVGGLRVRAEASTAEETAVVNVLEEGKKIKVDTTTEAPEGWVAVLYKDQTAYVSAEYVTVELELGKAISIEEERAAIKKAQEEKAAQEAAKKAAKKSSGQTSSNGTTQKDAVAASYDDVTLLGALIQCEAGGECYEGQVAVGAVVMNRLRSGYGGGSIYGVIYQKGQFTPASNGSLERRLANGVSGSCLQAAQEALNGVDNVSGALFFKRASSGHEGIVIGNHVFY